MADDLCALCAIQLKKVLPPPAVHRYRCGGKQAPLTGKAYQAPHYIEARGVLLSAKQALLLFHDLSKLLSNNGNHFHAQTAPRKGKIYKRGGYSLAMGCRIIVLYFSGAVLLGSFR